MGKASYKIKLSKNLKPYVGRVVRSGKVQKAFGEQIGKVVGGCVAGKVKKGMKIGDIHQAVRDCAKASKGKKLSY